jgi:hypothetical protein
MDTGAGARSSGGVRRGRRRLCGLIAMTTALLAFPAAAHATQDLGVTQTVSTNVVKPDGQVTVEVTVTNLGDGPSPANDIEAYLYSFREYAKAADAPYRSFSATNGSCVDNSGPAYGMLYHGLKCAIGSLAPGESARITAVIEVHDSMRHYVDLLADSPDVDYYDEVNADNHAVDKIAEDVPPKITGSGKLRLQGLPSGCVPGDFTLRVKAKAPGVKKVQASLYMGNYDNGMGGRWQKNAHGDHLVARVPISRINDPVLNQVFKLKVRAKRGGRKPLERIVAFQLC